MLLSLLGDVGFIVFVISSLLFTSVFLTMSKAWYKTFMGSLIALFLISVDVICVYFGLRIWQVTLPGVDWVRFFIFWTMGLTMLGATVAFMHVQFSNRGEKLRRRLAQKYVDVDKE